jgi:hypothetical protein
MYNFFNAAVIYFIWWSTECQNQTKMSKGISAYLFTPFIKSTLPFSRNIWQYFGIKNVECQMSESHKSSPPLTIEMCNSIFILKKYEYIIKNGICCLIHFSQCGVGPRILMGCGISESMAQCTTPCWTSHIWKMSGCDFFFMEHTQHLCHVPLSGQCRMSWLPSSWWKTVFLEVQSLFKAPFHPPLTCP